MQRGRIYRKGKSWVLAYAVRVLTDGEVSWAWRSKKLAPFGGEFRTEASVRHLAAEILAPINAKTARPESTDTVIHFLESVYLPHCQANLRPSTHNGYKYLLRDLKPHIGDELLREFDTVAGERLLADFAAEKRRAQTMLKNVKGFLSGAFRYAVRTGVIQFNPMRETLLPKSGKPMESRQAYTLPEIQSMLKVLGEPERTVVLVAALTGLRQSEIRGLRWDDYNGETITVKRSVWRTHVGETKTPGSAASIPVLPVLSKALTSHLNRVGFGCTYIFEGETGRPLVLPNLTRRRIAPVLAAKKISWTGWHGFRRGLASTLYGLGVPDKVIQQILRHASVEVTRKHYIKTNTAQSDAAMKKLADAFEE
jgi:integrase